MNADTDYLFVYGTLRSDTDADSYHQFIKPNFTRVGRATMPGRLYLIDYYPGLLPAQHPADIVIGEVQAFTGGEATLLATDQYEECAPDSPRPHLYRRVRDIATLQDGSTLAAWVYLYALPVDESRLIRSGDFLDPL
ncbi:MAG: gamma-glutamylcyclotransferase family protein [Pseudohongiellaceae bacterium]|jgi:gamma-glutamylcyclotransferase (GGCT)/AIG2-like uncharacterized protein YtfP